MESRPNSVPLSLVTGTNGHLGNNLVRYLLHRGLPVRASVPNVANTEPFPGLGCQLVRADLTDKASLVEALRGVEKVYAVGAACKRWAPDEQKEIYQVNMQGTRNLLEAAVRNRVRRVVYVRSIAALDHHKHPLREAGGFNPAPGNVYNASKTNSEKLARQLGIELVSVLPSAVIRAYAYTRSDSYVILRQLLEGVCRYQLLPQLRGRAGRGPGLLPDLAATRGRDGERYLLTTEKVVALTELVNFAREHYPEYKLKTPARLPRWLLMTHAQLAETVSRLTR